MNNIIGKLKFANASPVLLEISPEGVGFLPVGPLGTCGLSRSAEFNDYAEFYICRNCFLRNYNIRLQMAAIHTKW